MDKLAVVAVAYNRPKSLARLLSSLNGAYYDSEVDLIVSIDKSDEESKVVEVVKKFNWRYGEKKIRTYNTRQGLREHILQCGDLTEKYEAIIVFEDDIVAAENYYLYTKQMIEYFNGDPRIAGISLYSPTMNEMTERPFTPMLSDADIYFIQSAQSWGQCWTKNMWKSFRDWYNKNNKNLEKQSDMPERIYSWPESSWKKYYMKYIVETNKYFVYPYESLSTNAADVGQHVKISSSRYQVPMLQGKKQYKLTTLDDGIRYDAFFENQELSKLIMDSRLDGKLCVDLYGSKLTNNNKRYVLTIKKLNHDVLKTFGLRMRPHEVNVIFGEEGDDIYLYDLKSELNIELIGGFDEKVNLAYNSTLPWKHALKYGFYGLKDALRNKLFKI